MTTFYERGATDSDFHRPSLLPDGKGLVFVVDRVAGGPGITTSAAPWHEEMAQKLLRAVRYIDIPEDVERMSCSTPASQVPLGRRPRHASLLAAADPSSVSLFSNLPACEAGNYV